MKLLKLYEPNMKPVAVLENATEKTYQKKLNDLWTASFSMPADDPKSKLCIPFRIVELFDGDERVDLFRILPSSRSSDESSELITFECEHVLATLVDDLLFQYHEQVNSTTSNVISYILGFQTTSKWKLGRVDFAYNFSYKWESENLLNSIFSITKTFVDDYQWTWNTESMPWTLNLIKPNTEIKTQIHYGYNRINVKKKIIPSDICTRLYGLGYGEGINQLTISDINNGKPYIDAQTINTYGIISRIYTDTAEENANTLKGKMESLLAELSVPRIEYSVDAAHLYQITKNPIDNFYIGALCRVVDKEEDLTFTARVVNIRKDDIDGNPGNITIEISNSPKDIADSINSLSNRQRISEVYSQGSTNLLAQDFADNCDPDNPAVMRFYIPEETVHINKMELNLKTLNFRAYSRSISAGGAVTKTTTDGGRLSSTTAAGGSTYQSSDPGIWTLSPPQPLLGDFMNTSGSHSHTGVTDSTSYSSTDVDAVHSHNHSFIAPSNGSHRHSMYSVSHNHYVDIPNHFHSIVLPDHNHSIDLPDHIHAIRYGIYLYNTIPTAVTIAVDGTQIPNISINEDGIDIVPYLSVDTNGKIKRGTWHEITITPNELARIEANIITQLFIQSRGGGNY